MCPSSSYPKPSNIASTATFAVLGLRRFLLRYFTLPRIFPWSEFTAKNCKTGRYNHKNYLVHPYYVKPTFINRWGPTAWMTWILGGIVPGGKDSTKYYPEGYEFDEVGPDRKRGVGKKEMEEFEQTIKAVRPSGCPFAMSR